MPTHKKIIPWVCLFIFLAAVSFVSANAAEKLQSTKIGNYTVVEQQKAPSKRIVKLNTKSGAEESIVTQVGLSSFDEDCLNENFLVLDISFEAAAYPVDIMLKLYADQDPLNPQAGPKRLVYTQTFGHDDTSAPFQQYLGGISSDTNHDSSSYAFLQGPVYFEVSVFNRNNGAMVGGTNGIDTQSIRFSKVCEFHLDTAPSSSIGVDTAIDAFFFTKYGFKKLQEAGIWDKLLVNAYLNYKTVGEVKNILDSLGVEYTLKSAVAPTPPPYFTFQHYMETPYPELCSISLMRYAGQYEDGGKVYTKNKYSDFGKSFAIYFEDDNCFSSPSNITETSETKKTNLIQAIKDGSAQGEFSIYDISGRKIKQGKADGGLSLNGLPVGTYTITLKKDGKMQSQKFGYTGN